MAEPVRPEVPPLVGTLQPATDTTHERRSLMTNAVTAQWHGHNYQARIFWEHALNLLIPTSCVVEVTFEADGPKAFDDVVVRYAPAVARSGPERVTAEYHQVKWHVEYGGRFGYEDFIKPEFIGATAVSLLQRLKQARTTAEPGASFAFLTTYRVKDGDPLAELVSGNDKSLLTERLFDGRTDRSRMGKVRKLWREHLGLATDDELRSVVTGLRILEGHRSLDEVRSEINTKAHFVGLVPCNASTSDFRYDELARQLKVRGCNALTRAVLEQLCRDEGLVAARPAEPDGFLPVAVRSFLGPASDIMVSLPDDTLSLTDEFRQRYLQDGRDWQADIRPRVEAFLRSAAGRSSKLRLHLDAHASIAFLAGSILDLKSGVEIHLVQKGRVGSRTWRADDGTSGARLEERTDVWVRVTSLRSPSASRRQSTTRHGATSGAAFRGWAPGCRSRLRMVPRSGRSREGGTHLTSPSSFRTPSGGGVAATTTRRPTYSLPVPTVCCITWVNITKQLPHALCMSSTSTGRGTSPTTPPSSCSDACDTLMGDDHISR